MNYEKEMAALMEFGKILASLALAIVCAVALHKLLNKSVNHEE